ncbi:hypothetical protein V8F20_002466 [Naviculisporaceae sp. PSN 640]
MSATENSQGKVENDEQQLEIQRVHELYAAGTPLFTRNELRSVGRQIARFKSSGRSGWVNCTDLEGCNGAFPVGEPDITWDKQTRYIPYIEYRGLNVLLHQGDEEIEEDRLFSILPCTRIIDPMPHVKRRPASEVASLFVSMRNFWESSRACTNLRRLIKKTPMPRVSKIVAFACGAIVDSPRAQMDEMTVFRRMMQHAFVLTLRECLQRKQQGRPVRLLAQDPGYHDADKQVLRRANIEIVDDPDGWLEVDQNTLVFSIRPAVPVRQIIADIAAPAVMIWRKVKPESAVPVAWRDESSPRVEAMIQNYTELKFIQCRDKTLADAFDVHLDTVIYIRKD